MEFNIKEVVAVEQAVVEAKNDPFEELTSMQLLLVGGGVGEVIVN